LGQAVADLGLEAVFCDTGDGSPVKRAGAVPVGVEAFRPGLLGCADGLRRLLAARRLRLYARHGARL